MGRGPWLVVLGLVACTDGGTSPPPPPPDQNDITTCFPIAMAASCSDAGAATRGQFAGGSTSRTLCGAQPMRSASCTTGCSVEGSFGQPFTATAFDHTLLSLVGNPDALCAETPEAQVGDACTRWHFPITQSGLSTVVDQSTACLPTRAQLAADGTVERNLRLACDDTGHCADVTSPTPDGPLPACDPALVAEHGVPDVNGVVGGNATVMPFDASACLLAWDAAAQLVRSGATRQCVGDWQCGPTQLCDGMLRRLGDTLPPFAVCKPGPRGVLTLAMLAR